MNKLLDKTKKAVADVGDKMKLTAASRAPQENDGFRELVEEIKVCFCPARCLRFFSSFSFLLFFFFLLFLPPRHPPSYARSIALPNASA